MSEDPPAELARDLFRALQEGEAETVERLLSPGVVWTIPAPIPALGLTTPRIEGRADFLDAAERTAEYTDGSLKFVPQQILASGDWAAVVSRNTATCDDRSFDLEMVFLLRVRGAEVIEVTEFPQSVEDWMRFWT